MPWGIEGRVRAQSLCSGAHLIHGDIWTEGSHARLCGPVGKLSGCRVDRPPHPPESDERKRDEGVYVTLLSRHITHSLLLWDRSEPI